MLNALVTRSGFCDACGTCDGRWTDERSFRLSRSIRKSANEYESNESFAITSTSSHRTSSMAHLAQQPANMTPFQLFQQLIENTPLTEQEILSLTKEDFDELVRKPGYGFDVVDRTLLLRHWKKENGISPNQVMPPAPVTPSSSSNGEKEKKPAAASKNLAALSNKVKSRPNQMKKTIQRPLIAMKQQRQLPVETLIVGG